MSGGQDEQFPVLLDQREVALVLTRKSRDRERYDPDQEPPIYCEHFVAGRRHRPLTGNRKAEMPWVSRLSMCNA